MIKVTVKRSQWGQKALFNKYSKKMCCMGFCAQKAGATVDEMLKCEFGTDMTDPAKKKFVAKFPMLVTPYPVGPGTSYHASDLAQSLAVINDSRRRPHVKERMIKELGAKNGINFRFVD